MSDLEDLYREILLDHYRSPRNRGDLPTPPATRAEGFNPMCGDEVVVYVLTDGERVTDIRVAGQGCSIAQSSASMMSEAVKGKSLDEIDALTREFKAMLSIESDQPEGPSEPSRNGDGGDNGADGRETGGEGPTSEPGLPINMGDLAAFQGVAKYPLRIKCATLSWNTLFEALNQAQAEAANPDAGQHGATGHGTDRPG